MPPSGNSRKRWSRRRVLQGTGVAGVAVAAGCIGDDDDDVDDDDDDDVDPDDVFVADPDPDDVRSPIDEPEGEPRDDTWTTTWGITPEMFNFNTHWSPEDELKDRSWYATESVYDAVTRERLNYPTVEIAGEDFQVPSKLTEIELNPPSEFTYHFSDEFEYWNGDPLNAETYYKYAHHMRYLGDENYFDDDVEFTWFLEDEYTLRRELDDEQPDPVLATTTATGPGATDPLPPSILDEYYQELKDLDEDGNLDQEAQEEILSDLAEISINVYEAVEQGVCTGPFIYDDITEERAIGELWDEYPGSDLIGPDYHRVEFASGDRADQLMVAGEITSTDGIVEETDRGGVMNREALPPWFQQVHTYTRAQMNKLKFRHTHPDLSNRWVRMAIAAAVPWATAAEVGWGPDTTIPAQYHNGVPDPIDEAWADQDFLDSLYHYPMDQDFDLADEFLEQAGYAREGGEVVDPDGDTVELHLVTDPDDGDWFPALEVMDFALSDYGFATDFETVERGTLWTRLLDRGYDLTIEWTRGSQYPGHFFEAGEGGFTMSHIDTNLSDIVDNPDREEGDWGRPLIAEIPTEPGDVFMEGDTEEFWVGEYFNRWWEPGYSEEELQEAYRKCSIFYNTYVLDFHFHQYNSGLAGNVRDWHFLTEAGTQYARVMEGDSVSRWHTFSGLMQPVFDDE